MIDYADDAPTANVPAINVASSLFICVLLEYFVVDAGRGLR